MKHWKMRKPLYNGWRKTGRNGFGRRSIFHVRGFYYMLEQDRFIVSGETMQECDRKDIKLSYKMIEPEMIKKDYSPTIMHPEKFTQELLEEYFKGKPQLTNLHIEITSKCNERCVHCYIPQDNKVSDIGGCSIDNKPYYNAIYLP